MIKGKRYVYGDLTEADTTDEENEVVQLQMKPFEPALKKNTCFFSSIDPDLIFREIANVFEHELEVPQEYEISDKKWKMHYTVTMMWKPKPVVVDEEEKELGLEDENQDGEPGMEVEERAAIQIELLDAGDGNVCVEFSRRSGSSTLFFDQWQKLEERLASCNTVKM